MKNINFDKILFVFLALTLLLHYASFLPVNFDQILLLIVSAFATVPVILSTIRSLKNKKVSVDLLASVALVASIVAKEWASAVFINLMLASARIFGSYTESKASAAIKGLLKLRPQKVKIKKGENIYEEAMEKIKFGDSIIIEVGERIPVDGVVVSGEATIDESSLTGESMPVAKTKGEKVFSSTLNVSGSLIVRAEKIGKDTTLEKIIALVEESAKEKSDIRTTADKFAKWYIILTFFGAFILYFVSHDSKLLLAVLLVACADDIAIAIPLAFYAGIGYAARKGVIIKGGKFLEGLARVETMVLDKTGTLTLGRPKVQKVVPFEGYQRQELLRIAAMAEYLSEHPVAQAILQEARSENISFEKSADFEELPGKGTKVKFENKYYFSGNPKFFKELGIVISDAKLGTIEKFEKEGFSVTLIAEEKNLVGLIILADHIRDGAKETISKLRILGIKHWVMLTGDNERAAARVAREVGIGEVHANLSPAEKIVYLKKHLEKKSKTAMIGDGVNDAASLALADIGIAMGAIGSDAAIEAADIALMKDDLSQLPAIFELGRYTLKISQQDFLIWGVVNAVGLFLVFARIIGPEGAAAFNFITDFLPLMNSFRLFNLHLKS